jgi:predicted outer membrane repeat protein
MYTIVYFISNSAKRTGGAVKVEEHNPLTDYNYSPSSYIGTNDCFFQIQISIEYEGMSASHIRTIVKQLLVVVYFENNSAVDAGADLHGGSVDNCMCKNFIFTMCPEYRNCHTSREVFDGITSRSSTPDVSSVPLLICMYMQRQSNRLHRLLPPHGTCVSRGNSGGSSCCTWAKKWNNCSCDTSY